MSGIEAVDGINGHGPVPESALKAAKNNLNEHFVAFGLSERFDETVLLFGRLLGWTNPYYTKQLVNQRRPTKSDLPKQTLRAIEEHNALDIELYEFAKQRFEEMLREHGITRKKTRVFQVLNRLYGIAHPLETVVRKQNVGLLNYRSRVLNRVKRPVKSMIKKVLK